MTWLRTLSQLLHLLWLWLKPMRITDTYPEHNFGLVELSIREFELKPFWGAASRMVFTCRVGPDNSRCYT